MKKRQKRHAKILELINQSHIATQDELMNHLEQAGFATTQATISRDIRDLNIAKTKDEAGDTYYKVFKQANETSKWKRLQVLIAQGVLEVVEVQFMCVIKTQPQSANMICALLDGLGDEDIVATIAGYDTIIIIAHDPAAAHRIAQKLSVVEK